MKKRYCLISHTHWDREWYLPFENFRMRLVDLIDNLLDVLKEDHDYRFHLDAQTIVLDDYLAIRPSRKAELENHILHGRILVGPWYVQNDFHLTDGEATVRNLIIGTETAKKFGGSMPIGYAADQFGLISQLPQILYKAGLRDCVFGRGFDRGVTEFFWESEDGSKILCEHMKFWYNNAQRLSPNPEGALNLIRNCGRNCAANCASGNYLLMNGVDHLEAQEDLGEIIDNVRPLLDDDEELFQDTLPEFMQRLRREISENGIELKTFSGEFRDNGASSVLTGTLSSRTYLKQENAASQIELERQLEPLCTLLSVKGIKDYPHDYMRYLWKLLIENHPHDSICGCSVDAVHEHMMDRFKRIHENTYDLFSRSIDELNSHLEPLTVDGEYRLILINATSRTSSVPVRAVIDVMKEDDLGEIELYDENGHTVPFVYEKRESDVGRRILSPINLPGEKRVARYTVLVDAGATAGYSYRTLSVKPANVSDSSEGSDNFIKAEYMENELLRVEINKNGTINLTDKRSGTTYENILAFEDTADRGTLYNYVHGNPSGDLTTYSSSAEIISAENNKLLQKRTVKLGIKADREESSGCVDIVMAITLLSGSDMLDVQLDINNRLENHRLRVLVPTGISADSNFSSQPYDVLERKKHSIYQNDLEHPSSDFIAVEDNCHGIAVLHKGLYEYEQTENDEIALTVLRSVGRITGGWDERNTMTQQWITPGGQCIGKNTAHFAVLPYSGNHITAEIPAKAAQFLSPVYTESRGKDPNKFIGGRPFVQGPGMPDLFHRPIKNADRKLPQSGSLINTESPNNAIVVTAVKKSESDCGIIVRAYNSTSENCEFTLDVPLFGIKRAQSVSLLEDEVYEDLDVINGKIKYTAKPKEIVTILINT